MTWEVGVQKGEARATIPSSVQVVVRKVGRRSVGLASTAREVSSTKGEQHEGVAGERDVGWGESAERGNDSTRLEG